MENERLWKIKYYLINCNSKKFCSSKDNVELRKCNTKKNIQLSHGGGENIYNRKDWYPEYIKSSYHSRRKV